MRADLIIKNGNVVASDGKYEAVAVKENKILSVGSNAEMEQYLDEKTKVIDAKGNDVRPAFMDAHMHPSFAIRLYPEHSVYLYDCTREEGEDRATYIDRFLSRVGEYAEEHPEKDVVRGSGWIPAAFTADVEGPPTREDVDRYVSDRPVILYSFDCHCILVNTKALELAGIDEHTPTPPHGEVLRAENGFPTGMFKEMPALNLIENRLPGGKYSVEELKASLKDFQRDFAFPNGITTVFDALSSQEAIETYRQLAEDEEFKLKINACLVACPEMGMEQFDEMVANKGKYDVEDWLIVNTVKFFIDGGAFGLCMDKPFEKELLTMFGFPEDYAGEPMWNQEQLNEACLKVAEAGYQIHIHAMGDGAVNMSLNTFDYLAEKGVKGNRNVITHIENLLDGDVARFKDNNVIAAVQPAWACNDSFVEMAMIPLIGEKRSYHSYPYGALSNAGVTITCSSDFPVAPEPSPIMGIKTGVTRVLSKSSPEYDAYMDKPLGPADDPQKYCMKLNDVLDGYTKNAAYQLFREETAGEIMAGKRADIIIFDRRLEDTDPMDLEDIKIDTLIVEGEVC